MKLVNNLLAATGLIAMCEAVALGVKAGLDATVIDVLTRAKLRHLFGGGVRFSASFMITIIFVVMLAPIMWASHTLFLMRLLSGRTVDWGAQARHDHEVPWSLACRQFWPQTLLGLAPVLLLAIATPSAIPYALLIAAFTASAVIGSDPAGPRAHARTAAG